MTKKLYAQRDIESLDDYGRGNHYYKHVSAMTGEKLHSKSSIAAELGVRDAKLEYLLWHISHTYNKSGVIEIQELLSDLEFIYEDGGGV